MTQNLFSKMKFVEEASKSTAILIRGATFGGVGGAGSGGRGLTTMAHSHARHNVCTFSFVCGPNEWKQETAIGATTECGGQVNFQSKKS
jgi:hypothetical protein